MERMLEDIRAILEKGNFNDLVGVIENDSLEFKGAPYQLSIDLVKQELSKDIAGFANADGETILIGDATTVKDTHRGEEVERIRPFQKDQINVKQYYDTLASWVYPSIKQIDIRWHPSENDANKGIVAIQIPKQSNSKKPFLITKTIEETGKKNEIVFGYVERKRTDVVNMSVEELHLSLHDGMQYDFLKKQYETIQDALFQLLSEQTMQKVEDITQLREERVSEARVTVGLKDNPSFILTAIPLEKVEVHQLFESRDSTFVRLLENPPELRYGGFGIAVSSSSKIVRGQLRRVIDEGYAILELWKDGTLIFIVTGDRNFLSWNQGVTENYKVNQLALIESIYLFVELSKLIYKEFFITNIEYSIGLHDMTLNDKPCMLFSGPLGSLPRSRNIPYAPGSAIDKTIRATDDQNSGDIAFEMVREIYRWFGHEDSLIPYTVKINDHLEINPSDIEKIHS